MTLSNNNDNNDNNNYIDNTKSDILLSERCSQSNVSTTQCNMNQRYKMLLPWSLFIT